jgi:hypothetical protein
MARLRMASDVPDLVGKGFDAELRDGRIGDWTITE